LLFFQREFENNYRGFLIDNVKDEVEADNVKDEAEEEQPGTSKSTKRRTSNSSTTTLDSDSEDDNDNVNGENESNSKTSDDDIEIIKTYPTRSRVTINDKPKSSSDSEESDDEDNFNQPWLDKMREEFWFPFLDSLPKESQFDIELGGKFLVLKYILDKCGEIGDKVLVFSRSLYTLNHIEKFLHHLQDQNEKEYQSQKHLRELLPSDEDNEHIIPEPIQWIRDRDYFRMDGQTDVKARKRYTKAFNDISNVRARLFLISTLAGGIGINLIGSNRVIVFDASWNPSSDTQAVFRSYRFGQKKPVYIYRFLAHGTMEEKIYQRQVVKQSISQRVVDDHQLDRHFTQNDIKELYKFNPEQLPPVQTTSTPINFNYSIPKDRLLLDLLYEHNRWIHSYHSHDSLLENKIDEGLTVEERRRG
jgi:transcriptional regulator ATRX